METLLPYTLFGSGTAFGIALCLFVFFLIISEWNESGQALLGAFGIFGGIFLLWGSFPIMAYITWANVGIYVFTGFLYTVVRILMIRYTKETYAGARESYIKYDMKDDILRWWFAFPIAIPVHLLRHGITTAWDAVYELIKQFFINLIGGTKKE